jgi:nitrogen fixation protein FixH
MKVLRLLDEYRWPMFVGGLLSMSLVASGVIVWVATRPDAPRPIENYFQTAQAWDVNEAEKAASLELGWTVRYELPTNVPHMPGMPRPIDVTVVDRAGAPVSDLTGRLVVMRPSDGRLNQEGALSAIPNEPGRYRTLVRLDQSGEWEMRLDASQQSLRFVHAARMQVTR